MTKREFTHEEIGRLFDLMDSGTPIREICRVMNISQSIFQKLRYRRDFEMKAPVLLRDVQLENNQLRDMVVERDLTIKKLNDELAGRWPASITSNLYPPKPDDREAGR
jgi:hypothetical protein